MPLVLDLDPAVLGQVFGEQLLANDGARGAQGLLMCCPLIPTIFPDHVGGLEAIAADIEIITRHISSNARACQFSITRRLRALDRVASG